MAKGRVDCPHVRLHAEHMRWRSWVARTNFERWEEEHMLEDFPYTPGNHAWLRAVDEAQRVYPGTKEWLLSCSWAEGRHGRWVLYAGRDYYSGVEWTDVVGGNMQYRWSTFKGHFRHALESLRARGFIVPKELRDHRDPRAWLSALGQALAAGWARWSGNDDSHWSASWSSGCR